jgi:trans-aconitate 2-methyltransferase
MANDTWRPDQYERFRAERLQPLHDLIALVQPQPAMRVADLGCGTGEGTLELHQRLAARATLGLDSSQAMLDRARPRERDGLHFVLGDIATFASPAAGSFDLLFSNAALHWLPDHPRLLSELTGALASGGQLAVQVPANHDHATHLTAAELAREEPFVSAIAEPVAASPVLAPAAYAELLYALGYAAQQVRLQVYGHVLGSRDEVVEWVRGTTLTDYERRLGPGLFPRFLEAYRERLLSQLADTRPYFFAFKRILLWARRPA